MNFLITFCSVKLGCGGMGVIRYTRRICRFSLLGGKFMVKYEIKIR